MKKEDLDNEGQEEFWGPPPSNHASQRAMDYNPNETERFNSVPRGWEKYDPTVVWLLWFFLAGVGAPWFYLGRPKYALVRIFTLNYLWIGFFIDVFGGLKKQINEANRQALSA